MLYLNIHSSPLPYGTSAYINIIPFLLVTDLTKAYKAKPGLRYRRWYLVHKLAHDVWQTNIHPITIKLTSMQ